MPVTTAGDTPPTAVAQLACLCITTLLVSDTTAPQVPLLRAYTHENPSITLVLDP
jgi:hypothetical protein